jgi:ferredoxin--NADP+ reductase
MIATGTGLAPYVSMMRTSLAEETRRHFLIIHGARHSWELGYAGELISLQRICPRFDYIPIISRPDEEPVPWQAFVGYCLDIWKKPVVGDLLGRRPTPDDAHIFLCGNPAMVEEMSVLLAADGFREHTRKSPGQIHAEKYW